MRYRKLSPTGDYAFGQAQGDFWVNVPDGVAQAVATRLRLRLGTWFLDVTEGTDWNGRVLGNRTALTRDAELRQRVLNTPGVTQILNYNSSIDPNTRRFGAALSLDTQFGTYQGTLPNYTTPAASPVPQPPAQPINVTVTELSDTSVDVSWVPYTVP